LSKVIGVLRYYAVPAIVILFAIYTSLRIINKDVERLSGPGPTEEIVYEKALEPLKSRLPDVATVGYITDDSFPRKTMYFYLTQYALCPVLVAQGEKYPLVIGGYYDMTNPDKSESSDLTIIDDFGNGIYLYKGHEQ
jgi:hypothetical protein